MKKHKYTLILYVVKKEKINTFGMFHIVLNTLISLQVCFFVSAFLFSWFTSPFIPSLFASFGLLWLKCSIICSFVSHIKLILYIFCVLQPSSIPRRRLCWLLGLCEGLEWQLEIENRVAQFALHNRQTDSSDWDSHTAWQDSAHANTFLMVRREERGERLHSLLFFISHTCID